MAADTSSSRPAGGMPPGAPRLSEGRLLHPRRADRGFDQLGRATTLPLQRGAVPALRAHHAAGAVRRRRPGPGGRGRQGG